MQKRIRKEEEDKFQLSDIIIHQHLQLWSKKQFLKASPKIRNSSNNFTLKFKIKQKRSNLFGKECINPKEKWRSVQEKLLEKKYKLANMVNVLLNKGYTDTNRMKETIVHQKKTE